MNIGGLLLWEDEHLLAVNKPAGLLTIPDGHDPTLPHLIGLLKERFERVWTIHRLDKDTSGVLIFARTPEAHRALDRQFAGRETRKEYRALVLGVPEWQETLFDLPLRINVDRKHRTVIDHQRGKPAQTAVTALEQLGGFALLSAAPHTGYTHQIRAHLSSNGLPLLHDPLYQTLKPETEVQKAAQQLIPKLPIKRLALHALRLTFSHPVTGESQTVEAPLAEDFAETVEILRGLANKLSTD